MKFILFIGLNTIYAIHCIPAPSRKLVLFQHEPGAPTVDVFKKILICLRPQHGHEPDRVFIHYLFQPTYLLFVAFHDDIITCRSVFVGNGIHIIDCQIISLFDFGIRFFVIQFRTVVVKRVDISEKTHFVTVLRIEERYRTTVD